MKQVTNRTLAILVTLAVAMSIAGTLISFQRIQSFTAITGRLSNQDLGTVSLEVESSAFINVTDNIINFTNMTVASYNESEFLAVGADFLEVRNDGSVLINLTAYLSTNESLFSSTNNLGCPGYQVDDTPDDTMCVFIRCYNATGDNCNTAYQQINNSITSPGLNLSSDLAIGGLVNVSVNLTIPSDETAGVKTGTIIMVGSASS